MVTTFHTVCNVEAMVTLSAPTLSNHQVFIFRMDRSDTTSYIQINIGCTHPDILYYDGHFEIRVFQEKFE